MALRVRQGAFEMQLPDMAALRTGVSVGRISMADEVWDPIEERWVAVSDLASNGASLPSQTLGNYDERAPQGQSTPAASWDPRDPNFPDAPPDIRATRSPPLRSWPRSRQFSSDVSMLVLTPGSPFRFPPRHQCRSALTLQLL